MWNNAGGDEGGYDAGNYDSGEDGDDYDNDTVEGLRNNDPGVDGGIEGLRERGSSNDEGPEIEGLIHQDEEIPAVYPGLGGR